MADLRTLLHDAVPAPPAVPLELIATRGTSLRRRRAASRAGAGAVTAAAIVVGAVLAVPALRGGSDTVLVPAVASPSPSLSAPPAVERCCVPSAIRSLPYAQRVHPVAAPVGTAEGTWVANRPGTATAPDYAEVLLVDQRQRVVLDAFPLPGLPPQQLLVTGGAVFFVRQGDGGLPYSVVGRIDRCTRQLLVRVYDGSLDGEHYPLPQQGLPAGWRVNRDREARFTSARVESGRLTTAGPDGSLSLDARTLDPVASAR